MKRKKKVWIKISDISGSAVVIWNITLTFPLIKQCSMRAMLNHWTVFQKFGAYITHNAN